MLSLLTALVISAPHITSPKEQFGANIGDDYFLATYTQMSAYWTKLDKESDRMQVVRIGRTEEGRDQLMAIVSDEANMKQLDRYRDIARRLCLAEDLTDEQAKALAKEGKAVVWIDGGLHASEVLGAQQLIETSYRMVANDDEETRRILKDCIILFVHANPDGMELCSNWYMRNADPKKRSLANLPRLYQKYIGHDNNRDFYLSSQSETTNMNRVMYLQWFPQIVYNHHQTGPAGTVMFAPPFRDPFNYNFDPMIVSGIDFLGSAMMTRFLREDKPGVTVRSGAPYSTWWNGGLRTTAYFHNMIGLLTETIGNPTPMRIPFVPDKLQPRADMILPIAPQEWHFRQSIEYSVTANLAVLDAASRYRQNFLYNIYKMGRNSIEKGRKDSWTDTPSRVGLAREKGFEAMRNPALRDPRAYIIPSDQDFGNATRFVRALQKVGVQVTTSVAQFTWGGKTYPAASYIVRCDQPFRPHILDMFEPQDHPNDLQYPGGPPVPPYDNAGYTLAFQMGVKFDRILEAPPAKFGNEASSGIIDFHPAGLDLDAYAVALKTLGQGSSLWMSRTGFGSTASEGALRLKSPRVALWDRYGGSMTSGWTRWIFDHYGIPHTVVYPKDVDGGLVGKYDVLVLPSDATFSARAAREIDESTIPEEYRSRLGSLTVATSLPKVKEFMEAGGTVVTIGAASRVATQLGLPVASALQDSNGKALPREAFYIPGSILRVRLDPSQPVTWGMPAEVDVMFDEDPAFRITGSGVDRIGWYDSETPLRSGWALGQKALKDAVAMAHVAIGKGHLYLFTPEITFRGQSSGTFRLLFNAILLSGTST